MRILAVDDDMFIRELLPKIAARVGCPDITVAASAQKALQTIAAAPVPFDCLLLDINMPEMSGKNCAPRCAAWRPIATRR